jgi:hypothetical protein
MQMKITFNNSTNPRRAHFASVCLVASLFATACSEDSNDAKEDEHSEHADAGHSETASSTSASTTKAGAGESSQAQSSSKSDAGAESKDSGSEPSSSKPAQDAGAPAQTDKPGQPDKPSTTTTAPTHAKRYAVASYVFSDTNETSYIYLVDSLENPKLDKTKALELPGRGSITTRGKWLFVADGESPVIRRYEITDKGEYKESGRLDFTAYELDSIRLDDWSNIFVSDDKAYLGGGKSGSLVIWNPSMLAIEGEVKLPELVRPNLEIDSSSLVLQDKHVLFAVSWKDWDAYKTSTEQYLVSIDTSTDKLADMVREERCPALSNHVDRDEMGNLYFSNWIYNVTETLVFKANSSCALRVKANERSFDKDWILEYPKLTDGHEAAGLNYYKDGHGFLSVFRSENLEIDAMTDPSELAQSSNWQLWSVDLNAKSGKPVEGLEPASGGYTILEVDGHTLITQSTEDYEKTTVFEITGDSSFAKRFEVAGFCYQVALIP